jgi:hypothetical protein
VSRLGVKSVYTPRGMTAAAWQEGLAMFAADSDSGGKKQAHKHKRKQHGSSSLAH